MPNMGPCGKHPYLVPEVTEANPNAMASSAACCLFNATFYNSLHYISHNCRF